MEMTTALDIQVDEDIDLLVCRQNNQPPPKTLWPIATENQTLANTFGWEKIDKSSTNYFPEKRATVRVQRNSGKPDVIYGIYFVHRQITGTHGWVYNEKVIVTGYGETNERKYGFNGFIPAEPGYFQSILDTTEHIESEFQRVFGYKQKLSVP